MLTERRVLWFLRWLALLTIAFAFLNTGLGVYQTVREPRWSLVSDRTDSVVRLIDALQRQAHLILNAGFVWTLAVIAEHVRRRAEEPRGPGAGADAAPGTSLE